MRTGFELENLEIMKIKENHEKSAKSGVSDTLSLAKVAVLVRWNSNRARWKAEDA